MALENYEKSLLLKRPLELRYDIGITSLEMGSLYRKTGQYDKALPFTVEAHLLLKYLAKTSLDKRSLDDLRDLRRSVTEFDKRKKEITEEILKRYPNLSPLSD